MKNNLEDSNCLHITVSVFHLWLILVSLSYVSYAQFKITIQIKEYFLVLPVFFSVSLEYNFCLTALDLSGNAQIQLHRHFFMSQVFFMSQYFFNVTKGSL